MSPWLILIIIVLICLAILMYSARSKYDEGFGVNLHAAAERISKEKGFVNRNVMFGDTLSKLFQDSVPKSILYNPGLNISQVNDAFRQPDLYLKKSPDRDFTTFFEGNPTAGFTKRDNALCRGVIHPRSLPAK